MEDKRAWRRASALGLQHLHAVFGVGLVANEGLLPEAPKDSMFFVDVAKDALGHVGVSTPTEQNRNLSASRRKSSEDGRSRCDGHDAGETEADAAEDVTEGLEQSLSESALGVLAERMQVKEKWRPQQKSTVTEQPGLNSSAEKSAHSPKILASEEQPSIHADGQYFGGKAPAEQTAAHAQGHLRRRKVVMYDEDEEEEGPGEAHVFVAKEVEKQAPDASVREARRRRGVGATSETGKQPNASPTRAGSGTVHGTAASPPGAVSSSKGRGGASEIAGKPPARGAGGGGKRWGELFPERRETREKSARDAEVLPAPADVHSPESIFSEHTSLEQCLHCGGGPVQGFLVPCLGKCGRQFHTYCPGLSMPGLDGATSQRCTECLEKFERALRAAKSSAAKGMSTSEGQDKRAAPSRGNSPSKSRGHQQAYSEMWAQQGKRNGKAATEGGPVERGKAATNGGPVDSGFAATEGGPEHGEKAATEGGPEDSGNAGSEDGPARNGAASHEEDEIEEGQSSEGQPDAGFGGGYMKKRKKKVPYSKDEDEALQKGMELFGAEPDKWKRVLSYGRSVFQERDTVSLKDRWRNLQRYHK